MKVLITLELDCEVGPGESQRDETREALRHLGEHVVGAATLAYSKVERASIGLITGLSNSGVPLVAEPVVLVEPAVEEIAAPAVEAAPVEG